MQEIAEASRTGPATNIISGIAVGFETTGCRRPRRSAPRCSPPYWLGSQAGLVDAEGHDVGGIFGTAVATMGMLMTAAYILAMDTFGPITDNAGGIVEMTSQPEADARHHRPPRLGRQHDQGADQGLRRRLGRPGRLPALLRLPRRGQPRSSATAAGELLHRRSNLADVGVFVGGLLGAMLVFLFSSLAIRAVGTPAQAMIEEVRRQFREIPGSWPAPSAPTTRACVDITDRAALREMIAPGVLAVAVPIARRA